MCFSAQASFTAAAALSVIGLATLYKTHNKKMLPFALSPLFFAAQQLLEGIVWLTINTGDHTVLHTIGIYGFNFFAGIFWPLWIPASLALVEPQQRRKKILLGLTLVGATVSTITIWGLYAMGVTATALHHHITYNYVHVPFDEQTMQHLSIGGWALYIVATVGAFFTSSIPLVWILGVLIATAFVIAHIFYQLSFGSVWCFCAAIISAFVYCIVDRSNKK